MARKEMKKLIVTMAITLMTLFATAQQGNYEVLFSNSDKIKIGSQTARKGLRFDDKNEISMPSEKCALKIRDLRDGTIKLIDGEKLNKYKAKTISEYLVVERHLSTQSFVEMETIDFDTLAYYEVLFSNSNKIKIGSQTARKGLRFNDENEISMPSEKCALKIRNLSDGTIKLIVGEKLNKYKAKTISQYLVVERHLSTNGIDERGAIEFDTLAYMLDTLKIPILTYHSGKITAKAVVYMGNDHFEIPVLRHEKEMAYVIPRNWLGKLDDKPFCIDIIEKDIEKDWEYTIWHKLYIVPLPLKIE